MNDGYMAPNIPSPLTNAINRLTLNYRLFSTPCHANMFRIPLLRLVALSSTPFRYRSHWSCDFRVNEEGVDTWRNNLFIPLFPSLTAIAFCRADLYRIRLLLVLICFQFGFSKRLLKKSSTCRKILVELSFVFFTFNLIDVHVNDWWKFFWGNNEFYLI